MDGGAWWAAVHGVAKSRTRLSNFTLGYSSSSMVKNLPANAEVAGLIPGSGESPLTGNGNPFQYSCLGNHMDREAWWATVHGVARVRHDSATEQQRCHFYHYLFLCSFNFLSVLRFFQRRQWHPTPVLLPGKSHGWRSLVGCSPWGR